MRTRSELIRSAGSGALMGVLLTAPLMALFYLADQAAGLPLVMYDLFDWLTRTIPGEIIPRVIEVMVDIIRGLNLGETSSTAKTIENALAMVTFLGGGVVAGAILFVILPRYDIRLKDSAQYVPGLAAGVIMGLPMILISRDVNVTATAPDSVGLIWLAAALLTWGALLSWSYYRAFAPAPATEPDPAAAEPAPAVTGPARADMLSRREFLVRVGGASATLVVIGAGVGRYLKYQEDQDYKALIARRRAAANTIPDNLPNAGDPVVPAPGTRPEYTPLEDHYRIDINSRSPEIDEASWRLVIDGLVDTPLSLTIDDIKTSYEPLQQYVTLACISNPVGGDLTSTILWTGASLQDVLADAGIHPEATHLKITGEDDFYETVALDLINSDPRVMLTYHWDGIPLLYKHGFPLRIYIPDHYGMKQPKWIKTIEVQDHDEDGYWVKRGWSKTARMRATSVVDVAASDMPFEENGQTFVPVGGIAHAGARGISKVEVRVDDGEWVEAQLRAPLSDTTWVIWRYDWPFEAGRHSFAVRCVEGDGTPQIAESNPNRPSGATGIHRLTRTV